MSNPPKQKPGQSNQVVQTPIDFLDALKDKLGIDGFEWDLAASQDNTIAPHFIDESNDALIQDWSALAGWLWCNPPYKDIEPWVAKASVTQDVSIAMLVPASVGSNWWRDYVHNKAYVLFTSPRISFVGHTSPYPKDLAVLLYTPWGANGYDCWRYR